MSPGVACTLVATDAKLIANNEVAKSSKIAMPLTLAGELIPLACAACSPFVQYYPAFHQSLDIYPL
jgi:hypothetical protein